MPETKTASKTITKKELIDRIAAETRQKRVDVKRTLQCFLDQIVAEVGRGNRLEFRDFGVFEIKVRAERKARNPKTMDHVLVPAKRTVRFKIGRLMRDALDRTADISAGADVPNLKFTGTVEVKPRRRRGVGF